MSHSKMLEFLKSFGTRSDEVLKELLEGKSILKIALNGLIESIAELLRIYKIKISDWLNDKLNK